MNLVCEIEPCEKIVCCNNCLHVGGRNTHPIHIYPTQAQACSMFLFSFITKHWPSAAVLFIATYHILETFIVIYESHQNPEGPRIWVVNIVLILFATAPGIVAALTKRQEWVVVALSTLFPYYLFNFKVLDGSFYSALSLVLYTVALRVMSLDNAGYERNWREFFTIHYARDTSTLPLNSK